MTLLFLDGCDLYDNGDDSDLDFRWAYNSSNQIAPDFDAGRFGGGAIFLNESGEGRISTTFAAAATIIVGAALWPENATSNGSEEPIIELFDSGGTLQLYVTYLDADGLLRAWRGDGTLLATSDTAWSLETWRYVEVKVTVDDAAGYVELRLDGVSVATFSGDTQNGGNPDIASVQFRAQGSGNHDLYVDDVYVCDISGAQNNDFLGDVRIETLRPNADTAQVDWTPSTGTDHYAMVDDAPGYDGTDYVESDTVGHIDLWEYGDLQSSPQAIHAVQLVTAMQKTDAGTREARAVLKSGTTTANGATHQLSTSWEQFEDLHEIDPDTGAAWTEAGVNALQGGAEVVT